MPKKTAGSGRHEQEQQVEIAPVIIDSGTSIVYKMTTYIADEEYWAEEVYRAMVAHCPKNSMAYQLV